MHTSIRIGEQAHFWLIFLFLSTALDFHANNCAFLFILLAHGITYCCRELYDGTQSRSIALVIVCSAHRDYVLQGEHEERMYARVLSLRAMCRPLSPPPLPDILQTFHRPFMLYKTSTSRV